MGIVQKFLSESGGDVKAADIGIITPYAAQVRLFKERCRIRPFDAVEVASVDGFQGREKQVIVFSCVRANASGSLGFLADARRVNVMMTRAKRGLVIVGSPLTLQAERGTWAPWLQWANENGLIVGGVPASFASEMSRMLQHSVNPVHVASPVASVLPAPFSGLSGVASASNGHVAGNSDDGCDQPKQHAEGLSGKKEREEVKDESGFKSRSSAREPRERSRSRDRKRHSDRKHSRSRSRSRDVKRGSGRDGNPNDFRDQRRERTDGRHRSRSRSRGRDRRRDASRSRSRSRSRDEGRSRRRYRE